MTWTFARLCLAAPLLALLALGTMAHPACAHWADLAVAEVLVQPTEASLNLTVPTGLLGFADDDHNGKLTPAEIRSHHADLTAFLTSRVVLKAAGQPAVLDVTPAEGLVAPAMAGSDRTHSTVKLAYHWPVPTANVSLHYGLFLPGVATARCMATVTQGDHAESVIFTPEKADLDLMKPALGQQIRSFVGLGIEHILTGYDHILFLISLLMLGGGLRYVLKVVTAFTIAHSITLSLAVLNLVSVPPRVVESGIALTIVYVAAENFWRKDLKGRWMVTMLFGLVHGLGFAWALKELDLAPANLVASLVSFNVGVEIGQLCIVTAAFTILTLLRRQRWEPQFRLAVSGMVVAVGMFWFVQRAFFTV